MAYIAHDSGRRSSLGHVSRRGTTTVLLAGTFLSLLALFGTHHPLLAVWLGLALLGWLFIAGAAAGEGARK